MATLQKHGEGWYCQFLYGGKHRTLTIGKVSDREANQWKVRTEQLLLRIKQNLLKVPPGVSIVDFILHDGSPPVDPALAVIKETTLHDLRQAYVSTYSNGAIEANTLATAKIHLDHIEETLGRRFILSGLTLGSLQQHVDRRIKTVIPVTIQKEIASFRAAWNWGAQSKLVQGVFPLAGLVYPKSDEKLPFMPWVEIARRLKSGGDPDQLWEALYLDAKQVTELLKYLKAKKAPAWVYPMIAMAAHTGARRGELMRAKVEDIDLAGSTITIREMKRTRGTRTTRRVPISKLLAKALKPLMSGRSEGAYLFSPDNQPLLVQTVKEAFPRILAGSKWSVLRGWHTLRHSWVSIMASKGVDQRIIDDCIGHSTEEQRRRYRHLFPQVKQDAVAHAFG